MLPTLTKHGCNSGACHGAAAGRGGFHLSLLGAHPEADLEVIAYEFEGRRIDRGSPEQSLLLLKATGQVDHGGGTVLSDHDASYRTLLHWIQQEELNPGTGKDSLYSPPKALEIEGELVGTHVPCELAVRVYAVDAQGEKWDVSEYATIQPKDPSSVEYLENSCSLRVKQRGEHSVLVRYQNQVKSITVWVPFASPVNFAKSPPIYAEDSWVDQAIVGKLRTLGLDRFADCGDDVFLRRVTLDLTGRLPSPDSREFFYRSPALTRRATYVDFLLDSPSMLRSGHTYGVDGFKSVDYRWSQRC